MENDPAGEWLRLTEHYRQMYDDELLNLAADYHDLTDPAKQVLRDEMRTRGLGDPSSPSTVNFAHFASAGVANAGRVPPSQWETPADLPEHGVDEPEPQIAHEFTWKTPLCERETREEAWQIYEVLRRAGIESWIVAPSRYAGDLGNPRVLVPADQLDQAREVASHPIPQEIVELSKMDVPEFELPKCLRCGGLDPVLESVDPSNTWRCEVCGNEWSEAVEEASGDQEGFSR